MQFSFMNNTPVHFIVSIALFAVFLGTALYLKEEQRATGLKVMNLLFIPVFLSGVYVWTLVPFSMPLLIKSVGATVAFWLMTRITKNPSNHTNWIVCGVLMMIGGTLAVTMI